MLFKKKFRNDIFIINLFPKFYQIFILCETRLENLFNHKYIKIPKSEIGLLKFIAFCSFNCHKL